MAVERLAGSLSFLPLSSWHLYIGSYPQTSFLCEALPGPRRWLSPVPPAHLWLPAHHPEPGTLCFCACLPPGLGAPRRQDHPPLLSEPQGPVSLSLSSHLFPHHSLIFTHTYHLHGPKFLPSFQELFPLPARIPSLH